jgi:hypothetical protein
VANNASRLAILKVKMNTFIHPTRREMKREKKQKRKEIISTVIIICLTPEMPQLVLGK